MFHDIPTAILDRMATLERLDAADRIDGTERMRRLRQIPPITGRFLAILAASTPCGAMLEIGTSAGYSALWLALACRSLRRRLTTYEILDEKAVLAAETLQLAEVGDVVELVHGDALDHLEHVDGVAFCFLDAEKEVYQACYELVVPRLVPGGLLVADNMTSHREELQAFADQVMKDPRVDAIVVPIGKGELVCRKS